MSTKDVRSPEIIGAVRQKRDAIVKVRVTEEEKALMQKVADRDFRGSLSSMLRAAAVDAESARPTFVDVHDSDAAVLAREVTRARAELSHQSRCLADMSKSLRKARKRGRITDTMATCATSAVGDCKTMLELVGTSLSTLEPPKRAIITRVGPKGGD